MSYDYYLTCHDCKQKLWNKRGWFSCSSIMEAQILIKFINDHQYHHLAYVGEDWFYDDYDERKKYSDLTDEYTSLDYKKLPNIRVGKWEKKFIFSVVSEHCDLLKGITDEMREM